MAKYFIANRSVVGVVTINKEALDFKNRGFAPTDNDETYEAAKCLKTLGYEPYTEEEFKEKFADNYNSFVGSADTKVEAAKKTLEESEKSLKEHEPKLTVESVANIVSSQNTLKEAIEGGDVTNILSAEEGLKQAWKSAKSKSEETQAPSFEKAQGTQVPADNGTVKIPVEGEQVSGEVGTETGDKENLEPVKTDKKEEEPFEVPQSPEEKAKLTRSLKAKLADAKRKWDSSEDEEEKAKFKNKIETFENQLRRLQ